MAASAPQHPVGIFTGPFSESLTEALDDVVAEIATTEPTAGMHHRDKVR
jgi:hypothetical protein